MNAVLHNKKQEFELGLTGILGAAIFELTVGLAIGCFLIKKNYKLAYTILSRDLILYMIVLILLYYYLEMKYITMTKSLILLSLWIIYMIYLIVTSGEQAVEMVEMFPENIESIGEGR
jgi:Ca2+/Na+ antiporter